MADDTNSASRSQAIPIQVSMSPSGDASSDPVATGASPAASGGGGVGSLRQAGSFSVMNPIGEAPRAMSALRQFAATPSAKYKDVLKQASQRYAAPIRPAVSEPDQADAKAPDESKAEAPADEAGAAQDEPGPPVKRSAIIEGYLYGQIANVIKAGLWWVSFNPLVLAVFRGNAFGVGACRVAFNGAMLLFSPIAGVVADKYPSRYLLNLTTVLRGLIYCVLIPVCWALLSSDYLVDDTSASRVGFYVLFVFLTFCDGVMVAFANVLDIDNCGADMVAMEHGAQLDGHYRQRLNALHIGWMDAGMMIIAPGMGALGWYVSDQSVDDVAVVLGIIACGFFITTIVSLLCYSAAIPANSNKDAAPSVLENLMDRLAEQPFMADQSMGLAMSTGEMKAVFQVYDPEKTGGLDRAPALIFFRDIVGRTFVTNPAGAMGAAIGDSKQSREQVIDAASETLYKWASGETGGKVVWDNIGPNEGVTWDKFKKLLGDALGGFAVTWRHKTIRWRMLFFVLETAFEDAMISLVIAELAVKGLETSGNYALGNFYASLLVAAGKAGGWLMTYLMHREESIKEAGGEGSCLSFLSPNDEAQSFFPLFVCVFLGAISSLGMPLALSMGSIAGTWAVASASAFLFFFFSTAPKVGFATLMQTLAVKSAKNPAAIFGSIATFVTTVDSLILMGLSFVFAFMSLQSALLVSCSIVAAHGLVELLVGPQLIRAPKDIYAAGAQSEAKQPLLVDEKTGSLNA